MNPPNPLLSLETEKMRELGYKVIDDIIDHFNNVNDKNVLNSPPHQILKNFISSEMPYSGSDPAELFEFLRKSVFTNILHTDHPRFFSFIPSPSNYISVLADALATGHNVFAGHWMAGASAAEIESITIKWLKQICGFPHGGGGIFVSGGSMANLMAIVTAKKIKVNNRHNGVVYYSRQTHSSMVKALRILGFQEHQMRAIDTDDQFKIKIDELESHIESDLKNKLEPFCIIGNAGTTNTGAVDFLPEMAEIAKRFNLWFHIDGAYGAATILTEQGKRLLQGMELADSLTLDPHKWWFQPYEIGCLLVKDKKTLKRTFSVSAEYLLDAEEHGKEQINYYDYGIQLTRSFRALKLYASLKVFGLDHFKKAIEKGLNSAQHIEEKLRNKKNWKIITPAQFGIINFVYQPEHFSNKDAGKLAKAISNKMLNDGYAMIITTVIRENVVLRMCPIHPGLTINELDETIEKLDTFAKSLYPK